jgi:DNA-binding CsgD family transcriptional regulator
MDSIIKLSVQSLNFLFTQFSDSESKVVWIRTPDYAKQIYVSENYQKVWGRECAQLYQHPESWNETLATDKAAQIIQQLKARPVYGSNEDKTAYYIVQQPHGDQVWVRDTCFHLLDQQGKQIAVAGIGEAISQNQWEDEIRKCRQDEQSNKKINRNSFEDIVNRELKLTSRQLTDFDKQPHDAGNIRFTLTATGESIKLTPREAECVFYLSSGHSAKKIAQLLTISPRTVEVYIDNVKKKLDCRTRIQLISKLALSGKY